MAGRTTRKSSKAAAKQTKAAPVQTSKTSLPNATTSNTVAAVQGTQVFLQIPATTMSTFTVQHVDVEQSVQVMQTMLHGCLSSIVFQRSIFPPNCYETRYYVNNSSQWAYKDYLGAQQGVIKGDGAGGTILALKKGVSARVDRFLSLMETGIFDVLRRGLLKSLHLSIYESHPADILESWTLTVHYMDVPTGGRVPSSFDLKERQGTTITLSQIKLSLNDFIRKLTGLCITLPALPEDKKIALEIGYTNDRPQNYFAPGFPHPVYDLARFPSTDDWEKITSDVALLYTGHHAASLKVSHLSRKNDRVKNALPSKMKCTEETGKLDDVMVDLAERAQAVSTSRSRSQVSRVVDLSSLSMQSGNQDLPTGHEHTSAISLESGPSSINDFPRPSSVERKEQEQIRGMLRAPAVSNTQATQPALPIPISMNSASAITISQARIDEADKARSVTLPPRKEIFQVRTINEHLDRITLRCQCGHADEEGHMVLCEFCESYQHLHCYGYLGKDDIRLPTIHVCYQCLLNEEDEHLREVREQAMHRRALWFLRNNASFASLKSYGKSLGYTDRETERLLKKFRTLGLLAPAVGSSKRGSEPIMLSHSESAKTLIEQLYFEPSFGITHHLVAPTLCDSEAGSTVLDNHKRTREEASEDLPPAKRPLPYASGATFIDGTELNTPKSNRTL
ncbi:Nn.00g047380.m01.CDS01 [Neocucurbitaria sp. VM-36]